MSHQAGMAFPARYAFAPFGGHTGRVRPVTDFAGSVYFPEGRTIPDRDQRIGVPRLSRGPSGVLPRFARPITRRCASLIQFLRTAPAGRRPPRRTRRARGRRPPRRRPAPPGGSGRRRGRVRAGTWLPRPAAHRPAAGELPPSRGRDRRLRRRPAGPRATRPGLAIAPPAGR